MFAEGAAALVGRQVGEHRDGVVGEAAQVGPVDAAGVGVPVDVLAGDPRVGVDGREAEQRDNSADQGEARQPRGADAWPGSENRDDEQPEPTLEDVDQQAELGEAVGVLVEVHPV